MKEPPDLPLFAWARYPDVPGHSADDTSIAAAADMLGRVAGLRAAVLAIVRERPVTVHEAARIMGESVPAVQPRFSELRVLGYIVDSGDRRTNDSGKRAIVWRPVGAPVGGGVTPSSRTNVP